MVCLDVDWTQSNLRIDISVFFRAEDESGMVCRTGANYYQLSLPTTRPTGRQAWLAAPAHPPIPHAFGSVWNAPHRAHFAAATLLAANAVMGLPVRAALTSTDVGSG